MSRGGAFQDRAVARLPTGVQGQGDDSPASLETTKREAVGAADHPGAARVALKHVRADDVCRGPRLVALDLDGRRPEQVLVGVEPGQHTPPFGREGLAGDLVGLGAPISDW